MNRNIRLFFALATVAILIYLFSIRESWVLPIIELLVDERNHTLIDSISNVFNIVFIVGSILGIWFGFIFPEIIRRRDGDDDDDDEVQNNPVIGIFIGLFGVLQSIIRLILALVGPGWKRGAKVIWTIVVAVVFTRYMQDNGVGMDPVVFMMLLLVGSLCVLGAIWMNNRGETQRP